MTLGHLGRGGTLAVNVSNIGRALPSFAILVLAVEFVGIGARPAQVALIALAIPPMLTNSYVGIRGIDPEVREAAVGMGMRGRQVLWRVELPMSLPLVMAGVRTAAVQVVATATLAAVVAWGGLGRYIVDGLARRDNVMVFAGAVLVAALSVVTELGLGLVQRRVVSAGLTGAEGAGESLATAVSAGVKEGATEAALTRGERGPT
jgi:osmoprotectant transport system permease protein